MITRESRRRVLMTLALLLLGVATPVSAQTVRYIHTDALGSVVAVTDASRNVIERREYEPFGAQLAPAISDGPGYTGHVQDAATGLTYMQQRYYDPGIGRFLSVDPVTADGNTGGNYNRYKYGNSNPYRFIDPDGRVDWDMLGDSFKLEASVGLGLEAKVRLGPIKASLGLGSASYGGGVTLAPDGYAFQEVAGPSAALELGPYGMGLKGSAERSYQGRNGRIYSEEKVKGGGMFGLKNGELAIEEGGTNAEISGSASLFVGKLTGSADLGKAFKALRSSSKDSSKSEIKGFRGVFRVESRLDSMRLDKELKGK